MPRIFKGDETLIKLWIPLKEKGTISSLKIVLFTNEPETAPVFNFTDVDLDGLNVFSLRVNEYTFAEMSDGILNYIASGVLNGETFYFERQSNYYIKTPTNYVPTEPCKLISYRHEVDRNFFKLDAAEKGVDGFYEVSIDASDFGEDKYREGYNKAYDLGLADGDLTWINEKRGEGTLEKPYSVSRAIDVEGFNGKGYTSENKIYIIGKLVRHDERVEDYNYGWVLAGNTKLVDLGSMSYWEEDAIILDDTFYGYPNYETLLVSGNVYTTLNGTENILKNVEVIKTDPVRCFTTKLVDTVDSANYQKRSLDVDFDGFTEVTLDATPFGEIKYNEGYDVGYDEGYDNAVNNKKTVLPCSIDLSFSTWDTFDMAPYDWSTFRTFHALFSNCPNLKTLDISEKLDTSNVTDMSSMFYNCTGLTTINGIEKLDTSNVTDMSSMFDECKSLTTINGIENLDTSNVTDMSYIFIDCASLKTLDLSNWDVSNVTKMGLLFGRCTNLTTITGIENWDTSNVTNMQGMFQQCSGFTSLDLSNLNTSNVTNMQGMFENCKSLTSLDLSNWDTSNVTDMSSMFYNCTGLTTINGFENLDTSNVTNMSSMFEQCSNIAENYNIFNLDVSNVTNMESAFHGLKLTKPLVVSNLVFKAKDISINYLFYQLYCDYVELNNWDFSNTDTLSGTAIFYAGDNKHVKISNFKLGKNSNFSSMFNEKDNLEKVELLGWDVSNAENIILNGMFYNNAKLKELVIDWDVSKVSFTNMFGGYQIPAAGTFYYNPQYDYSKIIEQLPPTWTAVPIE